MLDLSVIICAHNPRPNYMGRVLKALECQSLSKDRWELLLVDNASRTPLADVWDISWQPNSRHIMEVELGLSSARRRGIRESSGEILVFVDDDNVLAPDYLSAAVKIKTDWPLLGSWGSGQTIGEFEVPPPPHLMKYLPYLALRETAARQWANVFHCVEATPWGAGLCVLRFVAHAYSEYCDQSAIQVTDRRGSNLLSGGDIEISFVACRLGMGMGVFPELKLTHLIPKERLRNDYFVKIIEGAWISNHLLAFKWRNVIPSSPFSLRGAVSIVKNVLFGRGMDRRVYFAQLRAKVQAKRIIAESQSPPMSVLIGKT
jgi:glycosyltransferase involved in cell wall biosynthesis